MSINIKQLAMPIEIECSDGKILYANRLVLASETKSEELADPLCTKIYIDYPYINVYTWLKTFQFLDSLEMIDCCSNDVVHLVMPLYIKYDMTEMVEKCVSYIHSKECKITPTLFDLIFKYENNKDTRGLVVNKIIESSKSFVEDFENIKNEDGRKEILKVLWKECAENRAKKKREERESLDYY